MRAITTTVGPLTTGLLGNIAGAQSLAAAGSLNLNGALSTGGVATLDNPRLIIITSAGNDNSLTWTVTGTNWAGNPISETFLGATAGNGATSVLSYATVTSVSGSRSTASTVRVGTDTGAHSAWIRFDEWADSALGLQFEVTGGVTYTFEASNDDPNSLINPVVPSAMTWDSTISPVVGATTSQMAFIAGAPLWGRINLSSGTGSVTGVFVQYLQASTS